MINGSNEIFTIVIKKWSVKGNGKSINGKQTVLIQDWLWGVWDTEIAYETNRVGVSN